MAGQGAHPGAGLCEFPSQALSTLPLVTSGVRDLLDAFESTGLEGSRRLWSESQALSLRFSLLVSSSQGRTLGSLGLRTAQGCGPAAPPGGDEENGCRRAGGTICGGRSRESSLWP